MFDGVKFAVSDINRILQRRTASKGGAPGKIIEWTSFWHEVIALSQSQRLNESQFPTQASLRKELLEQINEGLSEKTIKPIVRQIYEKFVKG